MNPKSALHQRRGYQLKVSVAPNPRHSGLWEIYLPEFPKIKTISADLASKETAEEHAIALFDTPLAKEFVGQLGDSAECRLFALLAQRSASLYAREYKGREIHSVNTHKVEAAKLSKTLLAAAKTINEAEASFAKMRTEAIFANVFSDMARMDLSEIGRRLWLYGQCADVASGSLRSRKGNIFNRRHNHTPIFLLAQDWRTAFQKAPVYSEGCPFEAVSTCFLRHIGAESVDVRASLRAWRKHHSPAQVKGRNTG